jgi:hypothetical protein
MKETVMQTSIQSEGRRVVFTRRHARRYVAAVRRARAARASVAAAFRQMANGVAQKAAWAATVAYYRSGLQAWTRELG